MVWLADLIDTGSSIFHLFSVMENKQGSYLKLGIGVEVVYVRVLSSLDIEVAIES